MLTSQLTPAKGAPKKKQEPQCMAQSFRYRLSFPSILKRAAGYAYCALAVVGLGAWEGGDIAGGSKGTRKVACRSQGGEEVASEGVRGLAAAYSLLHAEEQGVPGMP